MENRIRIPWYNKTITVNSAGETVSNAKNFNFSLTKNVSPKTPPKTSLQPASQPATQTVREPRTFTDTGLDVNLGIIGTGLALGGIAGGIGIASQRGRGLQPALKGVSKVGTGAIVPPWIVNPLIEGIQESLFGNDNARIANSNPTKFSQDISNIVEIIKNNYNIEITENAMQELNNTLLQMYRMGARQPWNYINVNDAYLLGISTIELSHILNLYSNRNLAIVDEWGGVS